MKRIVNGLNALAMATGDAVGPVFYAYSVYAPALIGIFFCPSLIIKGLLILCSVISFIIARTVGKFLKIMGASS